MTANFKVMFFLTARLFAVSAAFLICTFSASAATGLQTKPAEIASPDGKLVVSFHLDANGAPRYAIQLAGQPALADSRLGLVRDDADFSKGLTLVSESWTKRVKVQYEILTAKRRVNTYRDNRKIFHLATAAGLKMDVVFQVANDGVAFRYVFPEKSYVVRQLKEETSSFHFLPGTPA
jgi:hypothetical protein